MQLALLSRMPRRSGEGSLTMSRTCDDMHEHLFLSIKIDITALAVLMIRFLDLVTNHIFFIAKSPNAVCESARNLHSGSHGSQLEMTGAVKRAQTECEVG